MEMQMMQNSQNNLAKDKVGELAPHDFKASYKSRAIKTEWRCCKDRKRTEQTQEIYSHTYGKLIFN